jgi:hypothetical protein
VDEFLITATRSFKDKMQRVTNALGVNIGFLSSFMPNAFSILSAISADNATLPLTRSAGWFGARRVPSRPRLPFGRVQLVFSMLAHAITSARRSVSEASRYAALMRPRRTAACQPLSTSMCHKPGTTAPLPPAWRRKPSAHCTARRFAGSTRQIRWPRCRKTKRHEKPVSAGGEVG